ncbi:ATP-dependent RNA helicase [Streptococcus pneumoniae]|nr:ATP-dependent RNA helicase [Streptococcus pneumoniae]
MRTFFLYSSVFKKHSSPSPINDGLYHLLETYTHRAGRTGRMGKEGYVITLVTHPEEIKKLKKFASIREIVLKNQELYIK